MLIYLMLVIFIIATIITYILFDRDILQPAVIFCAMYTFSILCACLNVNYWGINLSLKTFAVITLGGLEFLLISYAIYRYYKKKRKVNEEVNSNNDKLYINKWLMAILLIYNVIVTIVLILNILEIASNFGEYSNLSQALTIFRENTSYSTNASLNRITTLLLKPSIAAAYICLLIFMKNIVCEKNKFIKRLLNNIVYLLPTIFYCLQTLLQSDRGSTIRIVVAGLVILGIVWCQKNNWKEKIKLKVILIVMLFAIIGLVIFYFMGTAIGRKIQKNPFQYITMYCGGSIQCLNLYLDDPPAKSEIFGYETFTNLIKNLEQYGIMQYDSLPTGHLEHRISNGIGIGNVYTSYRRWTQDFGYFGMIILQAIVTLFYNIFYSKLKYANKNTLLQNVALIIYGYLIYCLFIHSIDSILYLSVIRLYFITLLITIIIGYKILVRKKKIEDKSDIKLLSENIK